MTAAGSGPPSNEVQVALGQAAPPLAPLALLATVQGTAVTLQWTENPFGPVITGYQIHAGTATGVTNIGVIPLAAIARTLSVTAPPGTYFVRLVAVNAVGRRRAVERSGASSPGAGMCTMPAVPHRAAGRRAPPASSTCAGIRRRRGDSDQLRRAGRLGERRRRSRARSASRPRSPRWAGRCRLGPYFIQRRGRQRLRHLGDVGRGVHRRAVDPGRTGRRPASRRAGPSVGRRDRPQRRADLLAARRRRL